MRITVTIAATGEIFQQGRVVRSIVMALLTAGDIAMLIGMTDDTGQQFVFFLRGLLNLLLISVTTGANLVRDFGTVCDVVRHMSRVAGNTTGIVDKIGMHLFMAKVALRKFAMTFPLMAVGAALTSVGIISQRQLPLRLLMTAGTQIGQFPGDDQTFHRRMRVLVAFQAAAQLLTVRVVVAADA